MATVKKDGLSHNAAYFFMCSADLLHLYWGSHPQPKHSKDIVRTGQLFMVSYEADKRGSLFIRADKARMAEGRELDEAFTEYNRRRALQGSAPSPSKPQQE